jgi:hypothetical protein
MSCSNKHTHCRWNHSLEIFVGSMFEHGDLTHDDGGQNCSVEPEGAWPAASATSTRPPLPSGSDAAGRRRRRWIPVEGAGATRAKRPTQWARWRHQAVVQHKLELAKAIGSIAIRWKLIPGDDTRLEEVMDTAVLEVLRWTSSVQEQARIGSMGLRGSQEYRWVTIGPGAQQEME